MSQKRFATRLTVALVGMVAAVGWAGAGSAAAQTQIDTDFDGGTHVSTEVVPPDDLVLTRQSDVSEDFDGTELPGGWEGAAWTSGGTATVAGGVLTVDGARANTTASFSPGRFLDFTATFSAQPFQHVGFGVEFADVPWAMFSTGSDGTGISARTAPPGGPSTDTPLDLADPFAEHRFSIEWKPTQVRYFVDGSLEAVHDIAITVPLRPVASDFNAGGGGVQVDSLELSAYPASGTFTSRVFDAGDSRATWQSLTAAIDTLPEGVTFETRTGDTPTPDASWTAFQPVGAGGTVPGGVGQRYLQYRATLATTDGTVTPVVQSVTLGYTVDDDAPATTINDVTVNGTTATVTFSSEAGATFECSLDGGAFVACTSPREYTGLSVGTHTVDVRATDQVGNVGTAESAGFEIEEEDTEAPTAAINNVVVNGRTATVTFSSEPGATFECSLDNGPFQACTSPKIYAGLSAGRHAVRVRATDLVGNVGTAASRSFVIASPPSNPPPSGNPPPGGGNNPPPPGNPSDDKAPKVRPKPRSVEVSRRGRFRVRLRCPRSETRCWIMLRVRYRGEKIATKRVIVRGGRTARVVVRLKPFARDLLEARPRLKVFAFTTARDASGNRATTRTRMTLRAG